MHRPAIMTTAILALLFSGNSLAADIDFAKQVQPIFMEHCAGCHGEEKAAGKLRLHTSAAIQEKATADEHLIVKGKPEESELYERLVLPADHKKRMPKKADPLPAEKIALIRQWIEQGAVYTVTATAKPEAEAEHEGDHTEAPAAKLEELPLPEVDAADPAAIEKITTAGGQVTALYADSPLLQVSFALRGEPATDADLALLAGAAEQIYSLNLAKAQVSDTGLAVLSQLKNVAKLHLEKSSIADSGLSHLSGLTNLQYLNLYGTQITDEGMKPLEGLPHLRKLYVWQTKVSYDKAQAMQKATAGLAVDLGFDHPVIMRKRLNKQIEQAKKSTEDSKADFEKAKTAFERAKKYQEQSTKRLEELQKKLDDLDGKSKPEEPEAKPDEEKEPSDQVAKDENKA